MSHGGNFNWAGTKILTLGTVTVLVEKLRKRAVPRGTDTTWSSRKAAFDSCCLESLENHCSTGQSDLHDLIRGSNQHFYSSLIPCPDPSGTPRWITWLFLPSASWLCMVVLIISGGLSSVSTTRCYIASLTLRSQLLSDLLTFKNYPRPQIVIPPLDSNGMKSRWITDN